MQAILEPKLRKLESPRRLGAARPLHHVDLFCDAPTASTVYVVGDFNAWSAMATPMFRAPDGRWTVGLELTHGAHHYLFLVDGEPTLDPHSHGTGRNDLNARVSLIFVS